MFWKGLQSLTATSVAEELGADRCNQKFFADLTKVPRLQYTQTDARDNRACPAQPRGIIRGEIQEGCPPFWWEYLRRPPTDAQERLKRRFCGFQGSVRY